MMVRAVVTDFSVLLKMPLRLLSSEVVALKPFLILDAFRPAAEEAVLLMDADRVVDTFPRAGIEHLVGP